MGHPGDGDFGDDRQLQVLRLRLRMTFVPGVAIVSSGDCSGAMLGRDFSYREHFLRVLFVFMRNQ
jgi:hypothetical protein